MVHGAGGASRAAVYALWAKLPDAPRSILSIGMTRNSQSYWNISTGMATFTDLMSFTFELCRRQSSLWEPYDVVATAPDFEAVTAGEVETQNILVEFLHRETFYERIAPPGYVLPSS